MAITKVFKIIDPRSLEVDIPEDTVIQQKIGRYLTMIDDKIELNNKINENLVA